MAALAADRATRTRAASQRALPVLANTKIYAGSMVARDANGWCKPAAAVNTLKILGICEEQADNTGGANGAIKVKLVRKLAGVFGNSAAGDAITIADIGNVAYVVDDQTVAKTDNGGARPAAGTILDVDAEGVWVEFA